MEPVPGEPTATSLPAPESPSGVLSTASSEPPGPNTAHAPRPRRVGRFPISYPIYALVAALAYFALQMLAARFRPTNQGVYAGISLVSLVITLTYTVALARSPRSLRSQIFALVLSAAIVLPFMSLPFLRFTTQGQLTTARHVFEFYRSLFQAAPGVRGFLVMTLAVSLGVVLSRMVREIKILLPIAVVLALIDLYVVFGGGLVSQANSGKAPAAQAAMTMLTVSLLPKSPAGVSAPHPLAVGFADYLFIALFFACFARFQVPSRRTFVLLCGILCTTMGVVILGRLDLPALIPIAVVVIGSHIDSFRYRRDEAFAMLYAGLLVVAILAGLVFMSHRTH